jgi:hypothetical protein
MIRNGVNESLIALRSLAGSNGLGLLTRGAYKGACAHIRHPDLNGPQSLCAQAFSV